MRDEKINIGIFKEIGLYQNKWSRRASHVRDSNCCHATMCAEY